MEPTTPTGLWGAIVEFWTNNWATFVGDIVAVIAIVLIAFLVRWILHLVIDRVVTQIVTGVKRKQQVTDTQALSASPLQAVRIVQRTRTLGSVLTNIVNVTLLIIVVLLIVNVINREILGSFALLSAAIGAGLGFGAQNIVKDVLNGMFMVVEDQLGVGDIVDLGFATGIVEEVKIRVTKVRDVNGTLWFVRNGEILRVGNMSQGWARVILDVSVPTDADVSEIESALLRSATELSQSAKWRSRVLEKPEIWGLESIADETMIIRLTMKVRTSAKDDVAHELRVRLKRTLDELLVRVPKLSNVVLTGFDGATRVRGAKPPKTGPSRVLDDDTAQKPPKTRIRAIRVQKPPTAGATE